MLHDRNCIETCAFVDSGGNGYGFVDFAFVQKFSVPVVRLSRSRLLRVVDGRESVGGVVTHLVHCRLQIGDHFELIPLFVTKLGQFPIILGHGWLSHHNPEIDWKVNSLRFTSLLCRNKCLASSTRILPLPQFDVPSVC